ncbi:hypothetical protein J2X57_001284 [Luteibacter sp. 1214]|uniref:hypothetical protein n=1 Tax=Luteibacter sp. 1214 TaxID=2817735 RepID=UPI00285D02B9|nr:hypothetical protein [Luteibacter sp. 1214]MDR6642077.1 hypothetical protein [Luteibacter sp. 1214]
MFKKWFAALVAVLRPHGNAPDSYGKKKLNGQRQAPRFFNRVCEIGRRPGNR